MSAAPWIVMGWAPASSTRKGICPFTRSAGQLDWTSLMSCGSRTLVKTPQKAGSGRLPPPLDGCVVPTSDELRIMELGGFPGVADASAAGVP